jgi:hypothetical protein
MLGGASGRSHRATCSTSQRAIPLGDRGTRGEQRPVAVGRPTPPARLAAIAKSACVQYSVFADEVRQLSGGLSMGTFSRGLAIALISAVGVAVSAAPALADSPTIAGAQTVVPGQTYYGNLANVAEEANGYDYNSYWLLPETAGDEITIDWQAQDGNTTLSVYPSGTNDYDVDHTSTLANAGLSANDEDALSFQATNDGTLPLQFSDNQDNSPGPYSFTVAITHNMVVTLGAVPAALTGTASVDLASPDGTPLGANISATLQVSANGVPWTAVGDAAASGGVASVAYTVPAALAGKSVRFRAVGSGSGYLTVTSAIQSVKLPAAAPVPTPAPTPTPTPPTTSPSGYASCANERYTPGPAVTYVREREMSCTVVSALISQARFTGDPHWVRHGVHWGLSGGRGVGHYGMAVSGYACTVVRELHGNRGRTAETIGMNLACHHRSQHFGFVWDSWIPGFPGKHAQLHGRIWGGIR